ncbi:MAG: AraC family transcriptional regulator [Rhodospirillaceae bacterium]|nr:AraC family transcriptional regulator [Rhodospirillaceae bacterium]
MPQIPRTYDNPRATVAAGFVTGMLSGLAAQGADMTALLMEAGIAPATLGDMKARVPLTSYAALYNGVVRAMDDEGFGLFAGRLKTGMLEFLVRGLIGSRDLREALARATRYLALVLPDFTLTIAEDAVSARLEIAENGAPWPAVNDPRRVFAFEWCLRLLHGLSCWLVGKSLALDSVQFPYAKPPQAADYPLIYTEHPHFGGEALIARLHKNLLALPVRRDQESVTAFLEGGPGKIAMLYRRDHEIVRQIRDILATSLGEALSLQDVADRLHLSLRTVQRRLKQEGSSFRAVKAALRRNKALAVMENTSQPIAAVAADLGYAETSAFFRAFVGWTGEAPSAYRRRMRSLTP